MRMSMPEKQKLEPLQLMLRMHTRDFLDKFQLIIRGGITKARMLLLFGEINGWVGAKRNCHSDKETKVPFGAKIEKKKKKKKP